MEKKEKLIEALFPTEKVEQVVVDMDKMEEHADSFKEHDAVRTVAMMFRSHVMDTQELISPAGVLHFWHHT